MTISFFSTAASLLTMAAAAVSMRRLILLRAPGVRSRRLARFDLVLFCHRDDKKRLAIDNRRAAGTIERCNYGTMPFAAPLSDLER